MEPLSAQCRALDLQPEEPGFAVGKPQGSLRVRLHKVRRFLLFQLIASILPVVYSTRKGSLRVMSVDEEHKFRKLPGEGGHVAFLYLSESAAKFLKGAAALAGAATGG